MDCFFQTKLMILELLIKMVMVKLKHDDGTIHKVYIDRTIKEKNLDKAKDNVLNRNNSLVIVVDGRSGIGKTTLAIQFAKYLDPNFTIDQMSWDPEKFIKDVENSRKGACYVFDETMVVSSRSATSRVNRAIVNVLSQLRSRNLFIILNINSIFDVDRNVSLHRLDLLYHLYNKDDVTNSERRLKVYGRSKIKYLYINGKKYYSYATHPNFFAKPSQKYVFLIDEKEYEKRKRRDSAKNTDLFGGKVLGKTETMYKVMLAKLIYILRKKYEIKQKDVAVELDEDYKKISHIVTWAKDNGYIIDKEDKAETLEL